MLKGILLGIALTLVVALIGAYSLVRSGLIPANADAKPGWLETWAAGTSLDATLGRVAPKGENPVPLNEQNLLDGRSSFCAELRGLPWFREGGCVAVTDSEGPLSKAAAIGDRWGRGRPGRRFVLEDQARHSSDGHAFVRVLPQRPADLDARAFPEAHGQAAARGKAGLAASPELAGEVRGPGRSEIVRVRSGYVRAPSA